MVIATTLRNGWSGIRIPVRGTGLISSPKRPELMLGQPSLLLNGYRDSFLWVKRPERGLATYLKLVPRLHISGGRPPFTLYAFFAWTEKYFPVHNFDYLPRNTFISAINIKPQRIHFKTVNSDCRKLAFSSLIQ